MSVFTAGDKAQWQWTLLIMHVNPFSEEGPTIRKLHDDIAEQGLQLREQHHEIYLSDLRRTAPGRLRTVLRQPVVSA